MRYLQSGEERVNPVKISALNKYKFAQKCTLVGKYLISPSFIDAYRVVFISPYDSKFSNVKKIGISIKSKDLGKLPI